MALFTTLYSGSSGNCGLVREGNQYLLVDMGKSCRTTLTALRRLDLAISDCAGILVTHEHSDHVAGLDTFLKKYPIPVYSSADTLDALDSRGTLPPAVETTAMDGGNPFDIGPFKVSSFPTSHDVPCCGYRIETPDGRRMALATDLGILTPVVQDSLLGCDLVALEASSLQALFWIRGLMRFRLSKMHWNAGFFSRNGLPSSVSSTELRVGR